jgi:hypothetical protein
MDLLALKSQNAGLKLMLEEVNSSPPSGTDQFADGPDLLQLRFRMKSNSWNDDNVTEWFSAETTWSGVQGTVLPHILSEKAEFEIKRAIAWHIFACEPVRTSSYKETLGPNPQVEIAPETFAKVMVQLRALGLIQKSEKKRYVRDKDTYWTLTKYGETTMIRIQAMKSPRASTRGLVT